MQGHPRSLERHEPWAKRRRRRRNPDPARGGLPLLPPSPPTQPMTCTASSTPHRSTSRSRSRRQTKPTRSQRTQPPGRQSRLPPRGLGRGIPAPSRGGRSCCQVGGRRRPLVFPSLLLPRCSAGPRARSPVRPRLQRFSCAFVGRRVHSPQRRRPLRQQGGRQGQHRQLGMSDLCFSLY